MQKSKWHRFSEFLLQECSEPMLLFDHYLEIQAANAAICTILEKPASALIGNPVPDFFPGLLSFQADETKLSIREEKAVYKNYVVQVKPVYADESKTRFEGGLVTLKTHPLVLPEKVTITQQLTVPVRGMLQSLLAGAGNPEQTSLLKGLSEQLMAVLQNTEAQLNLFRGLVEHAEDGITVMDKFGNVVIWNKSMERDIGYKQADVIGKNLLDIFPAARNKAQGKAIRAMLKGKAVSLKRKEYLTRKGFFDANFVPVKDVSDQVVGGLCIVRDITQYLEMEDERVAHKLSQHRESMLAVWVTQIEERKRIAEKIHNSLGQLLFGFKMEFLQKNNGIDPETNQHMIDLLDEAINETRTISFELMPAMLEDFGLEATLDELVKKYNSAALRLSCEVNGLQKRLDRNLEIIIFSVVQELMNNVIKHAKATKARLVLDAGPAKVRIKVIDNGTGFEKGKLVFALKSTGLRNIKNSLKLFNGEIKISSQIGKGSLVTVEIPVGEK